ncbi:MAG: chemotaxis protein CheX [Candidatus Eisenbacteria bacterium]
MFPSSEVGDEEQAAAFEAAVEVEFRGAFGGRLVLAVWGDVLAGMVANMLGTAGEEPGPSRPAEMRLDALGEMANVICGNLLTAIGGSKEVFLLSAPRGRGAKEIGGPAVAGGKERLAAAIQVGLDGGRAEVFLYADAEIPSKAGESRS